MIKQKKSNSTYFLAIIFIIIVVVISAFLLITNKMKRNEIEAIKDTNVLIQKEIDDKLDNRKIQVQDIIKNNSNYLKNLAKNNKINQYIDYFSEIEKEFTKINLKSFSLNSEWKLKTSAVMNSNTFDKTKAEVIKFLSNYRENNTKNYLKYDWDVDLNFIESFVWMEEVKFELDFDIKDNSY